jgi:2-oxoglutarate ferredoxin oxidoreductase subunit delta
LEGGVVAGKAKQIDINPKRCKGCAICVEFCASKVLDVKDGLAIVVDLEKCTACGLCELRCPDFAITVVPKDKTKDNEGKGPEAA